jgi:membrane protein YdbS with pleckstrin-like domain
MEPVRTDPHDEALFDTEPSPQPPGDPASAATVPATAYADAGDPAAAPPQGSLADGRERHLHENYIVVHRIVGAIVTAIMGMSAVVGVVILLLVADLPSWLNVLLPIAWLVLVAGMGWIAWFWPPLEHRYTSYRVGPLGIELRKGVVFRRLITVPRSRIQHTDVSQGPIERQFGLATLHMFTAGTEHSEVALNGLSHAIALQIRDHLVTGGEDDAV